MKTGEKEHKVPLSVVAEHPIRKIKLVKEELNVNTPVPMQLLAFLRAGLLQPGTTGKPAPWGSEGPFTTQNQSPES